MSHFLFFLVVVLKRISKYFAKNMRWIFVNLIDRKNAVWCIRSTCESFYNCDLFTFLVC